MGRSFFRVSSRRFQRIIEEGYFCLDCYEMGSFHGRGCPQRGMRYFGPFRPHSTTRRPEQTRAGKRMGERQPLAQRRRNWCR